MELRVAYGEKFYKSNPKSNNLILFIFVRFLPEGHSIFTIILNLISRA